MSYQQKIDNLLQDQNNIILYSLPLKGKGVNTELTELIKLTENEITLQINITDTRLTPHAYPLVTYKTEQLSKLAEYILNTFKTHTHTDTGLQMINKSQQSDIIVSLNCVRTLQEKQKFESQINSQLYNLQKILNILGVEEGTPAHFADQEDKAECAPTNPTNQTDQIDIFAIPAPPIPPELEEILKETQEEPVDNKESAHFADHEDNKDHEDQAECAPADQDVTVDIQYPTPPTPPILPDIDI